MRVHEYVFDCSAIFIHKLIYKPRRMALNDAITMEFKKYNWALILFLLYVFSALSLSLSVCVCLFIYFLFADSHFGDVNGCFRYRTYNQVRAYLSVYLHAYKHTLTHTQRECVRTALHLLFLLIMIVFANSCGWWTRSYFNTVVLVFFCLVFSPLFNSFFVCAFVYYHQQIAGMNRGKIDTKREHSECDSQKIAM